MDIKQKQCKRWVLTGLAKIWMMVQKLNLILWFIKDE